MRDVEKVGLRRWLETVLNEQLIGPKNVGAESCELMFGKTSSRFRYT